MRKKIVAGNWKMNKSLPEALELVGAIKTLSYSNEVQLIVVPPFLYAKTLVDELSGTQVSVGVQNCAKQEKGAFTGEVSASMIQSVGVDYVIIGHSERRAYFSENNQDLALKVDLALANHLTPIYCCGEIIEERNSGNYFEVVKSQISEGIFHLSATQIQKCIIAYEPVWAIGTGVTATPEQAQEMHQFIRNLLKEKYGEADASSISILYGGSCNPQNAKELFALPDVDGGLIGGASLVAEDFIAIANSF
ncbi:MAG: triose-phosphate isomerase [Flavobacteriales bacterium]|nr:triose-phosphate isomerase [Flavobacteriales bacterium]MCB9334653.1 triose-phosphate isomerase [Flavobacteriales bacterium]